MLPPFRNLPQEAAIGVVVNHTFALRSLPYDRCAMSAYTASMESMQDRRLHPSMVFVTIAPGVGSSTLGVY